jgi:hypothetical protein
MERRVLSWFFRNSVFDWTFLVNVLADPKFDRLQVIHVQADVHGINDAFEAGYMAYSRKIT